MTKRDKMMRNRRHRLGAGEAKPHEPCPDGVSGCLGPEGFLRCPTCERITVERIAARRAS